MDWKFSEAKNKLSEIVSRALSEGPQRVLRRNDAVVVLSELEYEELLGRRAGFKELLLSGPGLEGVDLSRDRSPGREVSTCERTAAGRPCGPGALGTRGCAPSDSRPGGGDESLAGHVRRVGAPAPLRRSRSRAAVEAIRRRDLYVSVITIGELAKGIARLAAGRRKDVLARWLHTLEQASTDRILPVDTETAHLWGELSASAQDRGRTIGAADGLDAATAIRYGLSVMTRNVRDFEGTGAMLIDPWSGG